MKATSFKKRTDDLRKTPKSNMDKLEAADRCSIKKVIYRVSVLSQFDLNARSTDTLLDSVASVHVFNIKEDFQISQEHSRVNASYTAAILFLSRDRERSQYS